MSFDPISQLVNSLMGPSAGFGPTKRRRTYRDIMSRVVPAALGLQGDQIRADAANFGSGLAQVNALRGQQSNERIAKTAADARIKAAGIAGQTSEMDKLRMQYFKRMLGEDKGKAPGDIQSSLLKYYNTDMNASDIAAPPTAPAIPVSDESPGPETALQRWRRKQKKDPTRDLDKEDLLDVFRNEYLY